MQTRSSSKLARDQTSNPTSSANPTPKGRIHRISKQKVENSHFKENLTPVDTMTDNRTMAEMLRAPTEGCAEAIVVPPILAEQFELKHSLINMMTSEQFFGLEKDNPHHHVRWFNKITSTIKYKDVPNSVIKLILFPFCLAGAARRWLEKEPPRAARRWLEKEPPRSITTWDDLVSKFINEFFPPSRTTNLRNEISKFLQKFDESFHEAWERYKDLLHQDTLNAGAGGNLLEKSPQDALTIIENKSKVRNSRSKPIASLVNACDNHSSSELAKLAHAVNQQTSACLAADGNTFLEYRDNIQGYVLAATGNYNQDNPGYHPLGSRTLSGNTIANPKGELKAITTRSGLVTNGPTVPNPPKSVNPEEDECVEETYTDPDHAEYNIKVPPPPPVQKPKPPILRNFVLHTRDSLPPRISELKCKALVDLGASINLMPLSVWKKLGLPDLIPTQMTLELANRAIFTPDGIARDVFVPVGKFTFLANFVVVDYESDPRVPLILGRPFLRIARALIDVHGKEMILCDGDERLTLNMKHDTTSYSNHPYRESVKLINIFNLSSEDCLKDLVSNKQSGNPTFSLHKKIDSPEVIPEIHDSKGCSFLSEELPDTDSFNDIHPHFDDDPLSGSTTYSANSLLEEFTDELALISYLSDYYDNRACDIESDIREI
nr:reverse transcriptase domain-containing protein [Tanacetum cinerariifolium]